MFLTLCLTPSTLILVDHLHHKLRLNFLENCDSSYFLSKMDQNSIYQGTLKTVFGVKNQHITTVKVTKGAPWTGLQSSWSVYTKNVFRE